MIRKKKMQNKFISEFFLHNLYSHRVMKSSVLWTGEMAYWLRAMAALVEDPGSVPALSNSASKGFGAFWPLRTRTYTQTKHSYT